MTSGSQSCEVHIVGEVLGCRGLPSRNGFCKWTLKTGDQWECLEGEEDGQSQCDYHSLSWLWDWFPSLDPSPRVTWNHPIDVHYAVKSLEGWPMVVLEIGDIDTFGTKQTYAYGCAYIPSETGKRHKMEIPLWRVVGTPIQEAYAYFLNIKPKLKQHVSVTNVRERSTITTVSMGTVEIELTLLARNLHLFDLVLQE